MEKISNELTNKIIDIIYNNKNVYSTLCSMQKDELYRTISKINFISDPDDFYNLKGGNPIAYYCKKCGSLYFSLNGFRTGKIDLYRKMLCVKCLKIDTFINKYGCENPMQNKEVLLKSKQTWKNKSEEELKDIYFRSGNTRRNKTDEEKEYIINKIKNTKLERYGDSNYNNQEKMKMTSLEKYGTIHPVKSENIKQKIMDTKLERYGDPTFNNLEKRYKTCQIRYGKNNACESPEVIKKINEATIRSIGVKRPIQREDYKTIIQNEMIKKYGAKTTMESSMLRKRVEDTNIEKYGVPCVFGNKEIRDKAKQTLLNNTGKDHPIVNRLNYYGLSFDSKWELALWIYAKDHNEEIIREPICIPYIYNGDVHYAYPDFYYKGKLLELKGDHLYGTDIKFNSQDKDKNFIKNKIEEEYGVEFWFSKDIKFVLDYIDDTYGKNYLNRFYSGNPENPSYEDLNGFIKIQQPYYLMKLYYSCPILPRFGISPFDIINSEDEYCPVEGLGLSPFDI